MMADPRFFKVEGPFSLNQLSEITGCRIEGAGKRDTFYDLNTLSSATDKEVSFLDNTLYIEEFRKTKAGAVLITPKMVERAPKNTFLLVLDNPYQGYAKLSQAFYPSVFGPTQNSIQDHPINSAAKIGINVRIDHGAVIGANSIVGDHSIIGANSYIGAGVEIGQNSIIGSNVTVNYCIMGKNNIIHPGVRIGQDGFGFAPGKPYHVKVNQLGRVIIGDYVEIGANTTIDRGALADTLIGNGTKIDNLVHISHNVKIGKGCFITAQNGFAGSAEIGDFVSFGGQAGIAGHVSIGDGVKVAAQSGVTKDIAPGKTVAGFPAQDMREFWRETAMLRKLSKRRGGA